MDNHTLQGRGCLSLSILGFVINFITAQQVQLYISLGTGAIAFISGIMAIRYYWYAGNEKKAALRKSKNATV